MAGEERKHNWGVILRGGWWTRLRQSKSTAISVVNRSTAAV